MIYRYFQLGLRTLVIAQRKLTDEEFTEYDETLNTARQSLEDREKKLAEAFDKVEKNLTLLGTTAVEDKLQEGVPDTLSSLQAAGIQVRFLSSSSQGKRARWVKDLPTEWMKWMLNHRRKMICGHSHVVYH